MRTTVALLLATLLIGCRGRAPSPNPASSDASMPVDAGLAALAAPDADQRNRMRCHQPSPRIPRLFLARPCRHDSDCPEDCVCSCYGDKARCLSPDGDMRYLECLLPGEVASGRQPPTEEVYEDVGGTISPAKPPTRTKNGDPP
jgi:hypothetical protein